MDVNIYFWRAGDPETELLSQLASFAKKDKMLEVYFEIMEDAPVHISLERCRTNDPLGVAPPAMYPEVGETAYVTFRIPLKWKNPHLMLIINPTTITIACHRQFLSPQVLWDDCLAGGHKHACYMPMLLPKIKKPAPKRITGAAGFQLH